MKSSIYGAKFLYKRKKCMDSFQKIDCDILLFVKNVS